MADWRTGFLRLVACVVVAISVSGTVSPARAETLCDPSFEDCRSVLINLIRGESHGIDVAFWFMQDARYTHELIRKHQEGVPVRVIVDLSANDTYAHNADRIAELQNAGIPIRRRTASGILHWKMMLFDGQDTVQFSAANYSPYAWRPEIPYVNYTDEAIYFATDPSIVGSFRTKYDSLWTTTAGYANYANITGEPVTRYGTFPKDPGLNFPPAESFRNRSVARYNAETEAIDVIMFRITDRAHTDAIIAAVSRGVRVRLYTEPQQYRDPTRYWHSWNVDRLYMAGVEVRHRRHAGTNHQKSVILHSQRMVIFGSSNWTSPSSSSQEEHNYFTTKSWIYSWFVNNFERKWNNSAGYEETEPFVPLAPGRPTYSSPANASTGIATSGTRLRWHGGLWAHKYDVYFGTTPEPPLLQADLELGPSARSSDLKQVTLPELQPGTTYYWRVVSKTMADQTAVGAVQTFTTAGTAPDPEPPPSPEPPPPGGTPGAGDIVLHASTAPVRSGGWRVQSDASAAGGAALRHPDAGAAKRGAPLANPVDFFELTFEAEASVPYHLWVRGKADSNHWANDSVFVQFSNVSTFRIGTTSATEVNIEDCSGCRLSGWGWQDNGWGVGVNGPHIAFTTGGTQTIRVQTREDGLSIDQIILSPSRFLTSSPGALKNDATIYPPTDGGAPSPPPPPPPPPPPSGEIVLYASDAHVVAGGWQVQTDATAAGGRGLRHPDAGGAKRSQALANPADYFELQLAAQADTPYHLWIRGKAHSNHWANDSVFVQFSNVPGFLIGTTGATEYNLEDCSGCRLSGWGWQDNGWGVGVMGPDIVFTTSGTQTIRIQTREDGLTIDQIVLSPAAYRTNAPGSLKNDTTILPKSP